MRTFFVTFQIVTLLVLLNQQVNAGQIQSAPSKVKQGAVSVPNNGTKLSTHMSFDDLRVNGQRQSPFGATAAVEAEKNLPQFIDFRSNYNDRIKNSRTGR